MKITNIKIELSDSNEVYAYVTLTFDECFVIHDIRIIKRKDLTAFVCMPNRERKGLTCKGCGYRSKILHRCCAMCGEPIANKKTSFEEKAYHDVAHPINSEMREYMNRSIMTAYNEARSLVDGNLPQMSDTAQGKV